MTLLKLSLSPGAGGDSAVDLPWFCVSLGASTQRGPLDSGSRSCDQVDAPRRAVRSKAGLVHPSHHVHLSSKRASAPRLHKSMTFYFILPFIQTSRQFSATHGAGPALACLTSWGQLWGEQAQRPRPSPPACTSLAEGVDGGTEVTSTWRHI